VKSWASWKKLRYFIAERKKSIVLLDPQASPACPSDTSRVIVKEARMIRSNGLRHGPRNFYFLN
jgi:hypothetical protein